jgi:hypothetical protein
MDQELLNRCTRCSESGVKQLCLTCDDHTSLASKLEVSRRGAGIDLADERARGVVYPNTVTSTSVNTALGVCVYTYMEVSTIIIQSQ